MSVRVSFRRDLVLGETARAGIARDCREPNAQVSEIGQESEIVRADRPPDYRD